MRDPIALSAPPGTAEGLHWSIPTASHNSEEQLLAQLTRLSWEAPSYLRCPWGELAPDEDFPKRINQRRANIQPMFNRTSSPLWAVLESHYNPCVSSISLHWTQRLCNCMGITPVEKQTRQGHGGVFAITPSH